MLSTYPYMRRCPSFLLLLSRHLIHFVRLANDAYGAGMQVTPCLTLLCLCEFCIHLIRFILRTLEQATTVSLILFDTFNTNASATSETSSTPVDDVVSFTRSIKLHTSCLQYPSCLHTIFFDSTALDLPACGTNFASAAAFFPEHFSMLFWLPPTQACLAVSLSSC